MGAMAVGDARRHDGKPRAAAPGWQANNDLFLSTISSTGFLVPSTPYLEANSGGVYGWWGMNYTWSPDIHWLAYARPDSVGLFDAEAKQLIPLMDLLPLQTKLLAGETLTVECDGLKAGTGAVIVQVELEAAI
jgi:hypothetical protein